MLNRCRRRIPNWANALLVLVGLLIVLSLSLQEIAAEESDTLRTRLEPGLNYVGWLGPDVPVEDLFAAVPESTAIFAWSGGRQEWQVASRQLPSHLQTLNTVTSGAGIVIRYGGYRSVEWDRPVSRASGYTSLGVGWSLIAWSGDHSAGQDELARALRASFESAFTPGTASDPVELHVAEHAEAASRQGRIEHGDALWVYSTKAGVWLQRSDAIVTIRGQITGDDELMRHGLRINAAALEGDWFSGWIRTDGSFYIPVRADRSYRIWFNRPDSCSLFYREGRAVGSSDLASVLKLTDDLSDLQFQIAEGVCGWIISGTVTRTDGSPLADHSVIAWIAGGYSGKSDDTRSDGTFRIRPWSDAPQVLAIYPQGNCFFFYRDESFGLTHGQATQIRAVEGDVTGLEVVIPDGVCKWQIHGRAVTVDGDPIASLGVRAYHNLGNNAARNTQTALDGTFSVTVPTSGSYVVRLHLDQKCSFLDVDGSPIPSQPVDVYVEVADSDVYDIELVTPAIRCGLRISGRLVNALGEGLEGLRIAAQKRDAVWYNAVSGADGSFVIQTNVTETYRLYVHLSEGCIGWFDGTTLTDQRDDAAEIDVDENNVPGLSITVPPDVCYRLD